jgi:hypothetical protein
MNLEKNKEISEFSANTIDQSRDASLSRIYGFETKYLPQQHLSHNCINMNIENYVKFLRDLGFTYFIVLDRKNYLRRAIFATVGKQKGIWFSKDKISAPSNITVDINSFSTGVRRESLLDLFSSMDKSYERLRSSLSSRNTLLLTYEEDIQDDPLVAYRKVCEFLGVTDESPEISLHRTNPLIMNRWLKTLRKLKLL